MCVLLAILVWDQVCVLEVAVRNAVKELFVEWVLPVTKIPTNVSVIHSLSAILTSSVCHVSRVICETF